MALWFNEAGTPADGFAWWAVEHKAHPAFYLRSLMAGDFAPDRNPLRRHVVDLEGRASAVKRPAACGTCGEAPKGQDCNVFERRTGTEYLGLYKSGRLPWPKATDPSLCWLCSDPERKTLERVKIPEGMIQVCASCAAHVERTR